MKKLLVANRGEIALRIVRACRDLGISSVAVYSEPDRAALHVRYADEAYLLGPGPSRESYLDIPKIIDVARTAGADAVHPGYGFLAENASFAEACAEAGITFVGPSPQAIRLLGDKAAARRLMRAAGVPVVPGTEEVTAGEAAVQVAAQIGYPLLVKATGGGGGRGIRHVGSPDELQHALEVAASEAMQAFGNPAVYLEKYLQPIRHIEVQIIADNYGNVVALGERECSIQRRHQKIIEEAPSPAVDPELRARMMDAAVAAARAADYRGAGTVEFLLDQDKNYYFLEVNTRLQVEHPITELITGVDLVRDQIRIAAGRPLPYGQEGVELRGWAIECRIAAEDPFNNYLPSTGKVHVVQEPGGPGVRVDSSLFSHQEVSHYYDSLLAKLCVWGNDRNEAIQRMRRALGEYVIVGLKTNIALHQRIMENVDFQLGHLSTGFLDGIAGSLQEQDEESARVAAIAAALLAYQRGGTGFLAAPQTVPQGAGRSPWVLAFRPSRFGAFRGG